MSLAPHSVRDLDAGLGLLMMESCSKQTLDTTETRHLDGLVILSADPGVPRPTTQL